VENFKCRSYNYVYMICSFKQMENPLITKYTLEYHLPLIKYNDSSNVRVYNLNFLNVLYGKWLCALCIL